MDNEMSKFQGDKRVINAVYDASLDEFGPTPRGITWGSEESQHNRFQVLTEIGELAYSRVLDVGCGLGDLFGFITNARDISIKRYLGVDINPRLIEEAGKKYPGGEFAVSDILEWNLRIYPAFDYAFASGTFGIDIPHWREFTEAMIRKMWEETSKGIAFNFLSTWSGTRTGSHYVDPAEMLEWLCVNITTKIVLRQDYKPNDFTIYAYH